MENLIEHEGKKYRVVKDPEGGFPCYTCCFDSLTEGCLLVDLGNTTDFPDCVTDDCHFELVTETNPE